MKLLYAVYFIRNLSFRASASKLKVEMGQVSPSEVQIKRLVSREIL